jgi:predicted nucleic acid-binding protein
MLVVLSNAGPLITLAKLNRLDLLETLYQQVQIPRAVYTEVVTQGLRYGAPDALLIKAFWQDHGWPIIEVPANQLANYTPSVILDRGETELLTLAQSVPNPLVLIDDEIARSEARRLQLRVHGTLGILVQAYQQGLLSLPQVKLLFQEIGARTDIWIAAKLCQQVFNSLPKKI